VDLFCKYIGVYLIQQQQPPAELLRLALRAEP